MGYGPSTTAVAETWTKGEKQEAKCNDIPFAILFYINIIIVTFVAVAMGAPEVDFGSTKSDDKIPYDTLFEATIVLSAFSAALSVAIFFIFISYANILIKMALLFSCVMSLVAALAMLSYSPIGAAICLLFFALNCCYAYCVWSRIPFATANLVTATQSVKVNCGVTLVAYCSVFVACVWNLIWVVAMMGINVKQEANEGEGAEMPYGIYAAMLLSYFFAQQVFTNTIHVIVAGVVGTWWFNPEESGCCSNAVFGSMFRAVTSAFGSICMGSFLVALIRTLEQLARQAREHDECQALMCIVECIMSILADLIEYFNKWAFIYVGLYGYSYVEAGKNVFQLFKSRGWETIIADDLVGGVLTMVSVIGGLCTGAAGYLLYHEVDVDGDIGDYVGYIAAGIGFLIGLIVISITMSVIGSAVNTVIVCFADAPAEFQSNHPELSNKMRAAWMSAHPDNFS